MGEGGVVMAWEWEEWRDWKEEWGVEDDGLIRIGRRGKNTNKLR